MKYLDLFMNLYTFYIVSREHNDISFLFICACLLILSQFLTHIYAKNILHIWLLSEVSFHIVMHWML